MTIKGIRQLDPRLPIDSKINRVLLDPVVLGIPAHIRWLLDLDPTREWAEWYLLGPIEHLSFEPVRYGRTQFCRESPDIMFLLGRGRPLIMPPSGSSEDLFLFPFPRYWPLSGRPPYQ